MKNYHIATYHQPSMKFAEVLPKQDHRVVIRLGGTMAYAEYPIQINSAKAVKNSINKLKQKQLLMHANIRTLPLINTNHAKDEFPVVVKGVVRSCGSSVHIVNNEKELEKAIAKCNKDNEGYYIEPLFKATSEYRLHCTKEGVFFAVKKVKEDKDAIIITAKNHHNVRDFIKPRLWSVIKEECINAIDALGLDVCCFDIMYSSANNNQHEFFIAEANTNPEMLKNTFNAYVPALTKLVEQKIVEYEKHIKEPEQKVKPTPVKKDRQAAEKPIKLSDEQVLHCTKCLLEGNYTVNNNQVIINL